MMAIQLSNTCARISLIVSCCFDTSFKTVKSKTTLSNIGLLIDGPANNNVVFRSASHPRFLPPCSLSFPTWFSIQAAMNDGLVPTLNDGLVPTVMQHIRYAISTSASSKSQVPWEIVANCRGIPPSKSTLQYVSLAPGHRHLIWNTLSSRWSTR